MTDIVCVINLIINAFKLNIDQFQSFEIPNSTVDNIITQNCGHHRAELGLVSGVTSV